jgi:hypothetical protein
MKILSQQLHGGSDEYRTTTNRTVDRSTGAGPPECQAGSLHCITWTRYTCFSWFSSSFVRYYFHISKCFMTCGKIRWGLGPSRKSKKNRDMHPCLERDSNSRPHPAGPLDRVGRGCFCFHLQHLISRQLLMTILMKKSCASWATIYMSSWQLQWPWLECHGGQWAS